MSEKRSDKLLRELMALYAKYGASEFQAALTSLESGAVTDVLRRAILSRKSVGAKGSLKKEAETGVSNKRLQELVKNLREKGDEKSRNIEIFLDFLATKERFPTNASLRVAAEAIKLKLPIKIDRAGALLLIAEKLEDLSATEVRKLIDYARSDFRSSSSLQAWSDVILKRR